MTISNLCAIPWMVEVTENFTLRRTASLFSMPGTDCVDDKRAWPRSRRENVKKKKLKTRKRGRGERGESENPTV